jgi:ABC-type amino acid transport system permease subunit
MTCGRATADIAPESPAPRVVVEQARPITAALSDFATGATEQNQVYVGNRLLYHVGGEEMDPLRNGRVALQLALQLFLFTLGPFLASIILGSVGSFLFLVATALGSGAIRALAVLTLVLSTLAWLVWIVCWVVGFFRSVPIRNAEWVMLIDDKGPTAPAVFAHIASALERRRTPAETIRVKRVPIPGGGQRDMLEVRFRRHFIGYVTAYEFGTDLHIGWNFTWQLSCWRFFLLLIGALFNGMRGRQTELHILARYEPAKTMREALHAVAREGVDVASSGVALSTALPANIPVDAVAGFAPDGEGLFAS